MSCELGICDDPCACVPGMSVRYADGTRIEVLAAPLRRVTLTTPHGPIEADSLATLEELGLWAAEIT